MISRRAAVASAASAALWPMLARSQTPVRRVGVLMSLAESDPEAKLRATALEEGLAQRGWVLGRSLQIDYRWAGGPRGNLPDDAADLARLKPDVMISVALSATRALQQASREIPI